MKTSYKATAWVGAGGLGLLVLGVVVMVFLNTPRSISKESSVVPTTPKLIAINSPSSEVHDSPQPELVVPRLDPVDYPPGSVGHECGVNEFPPRDFLSQQSYEQYWKLMENFWAVLENEKCHTAIERQVNSVNPYLWGRENRTSGPHLVFAFVNIENPVTFERIFTDPVGDLARVQEALARPECQLGKDAESNWQLSETCHTDAILNYALITQFCYDEGIQNRIRESGMNLDRPLIELAARLGDETAGLTQGGTLGGNGYKYGPLTEWFSSLNELHDTTHLFTKHPPSVDRLRRHLALFAENPTIDGKTIDFDHEALVKHLCTPPYFTLQYNDEEPGPEPPSCRTIVAELRQELHDNQTFLGFIATFEDVAMHLEVYE